jgi:hypothetical protein
MFIRHIKSVGVENEGINNLRLFLTCCKINA